MPSYLAFWKCKGMDRMDEWEAHFNSPAAQSDSAERATHRAIHLQYGGCYDELIGTESIDRGALYCIEYFAAHSGTASAEIERHFRARAERQYARLDFLLRRIGRLGPDPGCIALWTLPDYATLEPFERSRDDDDPFRPTVTGIYRWFGREVL